MASSSVVDESRAWCGGLSVYKMRMARGKWEEEKGKAKKKRRLYRERGSRK